MINLSWRPATEAPTQSGFYLLYIDSETEVGPFDEEIWIYEPYLTSGHIEIKTDGTICLETDVDEQWQEVIAYAGPIEPPKDLA